MGSNPKDFIPGVDTLPLYEESYDDRSAYADENPE